jgi:hypothetical protein
MSLAIPASHFLKYGALFAFAAQCSPELDTENPYYALGSLPIAQVFRYFWSAEAWEVVLDFTSSNVAAPGQLPYTVSAVGDSGMIPYPNGYEQSGAIFPNHIIPSPYDTTPTIQQRMEGHLNVGGSFIFDTVEGGTPVTDGFGLSVSLFVPPTDLISSPPIYIGPAILIDEEVTGNCYMGVQISGDGFTSVNGLNGTYTKPCGLTCTLDGMAIELYQLDEDYSVYSGSITITTSDTPTPSS